MKKSVLVASVLSASILFSGVGSVLGTSEASAKTTTSSKTYDLKKQKTLSVGFYSKTKSKYGVLKAGRMYVNNTAYKGYITSYKGTNYRILNGNIYNVSGGFNTANRYTGDIRLRYKTHQQKNGTKIQYTTTKTTLKVVNGRVTKVHMNTKIIN